MCERTAQSRLTEYYVDNTKVVAEFLIVEKADKSIKAKTSYTTPAAARLYNELRSQFPGIHPTPLKRLTLVVLISVKQNEF